MITCPIFFSPLNSSFALISGEEWVRGGGTGIMLVLCDGCMLPIKVMFENGVVTFIPYISLISFPRFLIFRHLAKGEARAPFCFPLGI